MMHFIVGIFMYADIFEQRKKKCVNILSKYKSEMSGDIESIVEFIKKHFGEKVRGYNWNRILENVLAVEVEDWTDTWYDKTGFTIKLNLPCTSIKFTVSCKIETGEVEKEIEWESY